MNIRSYDYEQYRFIVANPALLILFGLIFFFGSSALWAAEDSPSPSHSFQEEMLSEKPAGSPEDDLKLNKTYLKGYIRDAGKILSSPLYWDKKDGAVAFLVLSITAGLYAYDQDIKDWFQKKRNSTTNDLADVFTLFGKGVYTLPAMGLVYLYGDVRESEKAKRIGLLGAESLLLSSAFTEVLKFASHRHRPEKGDSYDQWDGPKFSADNLSFPSEHVTAAFSLATVVASEGDNPCVAPAAYGMASLVALSRLNDNRHWSSDAFVAAAIGHFTAKAVLRYHQKKDRSFALFPDVGDNRYGVLMTYRF